jgi:hypothetical protein
VFCLAGWGQPQGDYISGITVAIARMVDPGKLAKWECGDREPAGGYAARAERFLAAAEVVCAPTAALLA